MSKRKEPFSDTELGAALAEVERGSDAPGCDGLTVSRFSAEAGERLSDLGAELRAGRYQPQALRRVRIPKPDGGVRVLSIPTARDRVVIALVRRRLAPAVEAKLGEAAHAYRPRRSARTAAEAVARRIREGARWVALVDIREFFDHIHLPRLVRALGPLVEEPRLLAVVERLLIAHALRADRGIAQGSSLSPLLSNLALCPIDRLHNARTLPLVRYSDNLCVPVATERRAREVLARIERALSALGLSTKPGATRVAEVAGGFEWLGFHFGPGGPTASRGAVAALRERVERALGIGASPMDAERIATPIVRGWAQYFREPLAADVDLGRHAGLIRGLLATWSVSGAPGDASVSNAEPELDLDDWIDCLPSHAAQAEPSSTSVGSSQGEQVASLLAEADRFATQGRFIEADEAFQPAEAEAARGREPAPAPVDSIPEPDDEAIDAFLGLFAAGQGGYEQAPVDAGATRHYTWQGRPPGRLEVLRHFAGASSLAIRPRLEDGRCTLGVIDVDGHGADAPLRIEAFRRALSHVLAAFDLVGLWEATGGRGIHIWVPAGEPVPAGEMAALLRTVVELAGAPGGGVTIECLPGPDGAIDLHQQAMALPLGRHAGTGERSRLAWLEGADIGSELRELLGGRTNPREAFVEPPNEERHDGGDAIVGTTTAPEWSRLGRGVARVIGGCALIRSLADRARATGHLDHGERLSLLYSLGHLGPDGERAIHAIVASCNDYDVLETGRQIRKLAGLPIGCTRLREKHLTPELAPACNCEFAGVRARGGYPTPLLHASGFRRSWRDLLRGRREAEQQFIATPPGERPIQIGGPSVDEGQDTVQATSSRQFPHDEPASARANPPATTNPPATRANEAPGSSRDADPKAAATDAALDVPERADGSLDVRFAPPHLWA